ncbi:hypothetical protein Teth39_0849 [Thermoanaerobacter pseudethanolicus ATCC 33223]|jgi:TPP-dependent pyruvate/acetoin dehydrogenase alpha subunit|uniref:Uncharacterized protein n=1 Tax=Thermoanaerobacter pseudethanolicus (strain ATCC 33223 / 39E) TaxID=340099 RepID=B0K8P2_THEP3|nr:hypothetical protein Teth514_1379 [Thermoanaerobacter sp. X514]ABY94505.1 hypothetical protein Teth39_0849 [Thermoanaerobacter pseudethanolicus ATCC 33223]
MLYLIRHGHLIAKGGNLKYMMAELFGKETGMKKLILLKG